MALGENDGGRLEREPPRRRPRAVVTSVIKMLAGCGFQTVECASARAGLILAMIGDAWRRTATTTRRVKGSN